MLVLTYCTKTSENVLLNAIFSTCIKVKIIFIIYLVLNIEFTESDCLHIASGNIQ